MGLRAAEGRAREGIVSSEAPTAAERIVQAIIRDLTDRRGLRQVWEDIDEDVQEEIVRAWTRLIERELTR